MQSLKRFADARPREAVALVVRPEARERLPIAGAPRLSVAAAQLLREIRVSDEYGDDHAIQVPVERPLSVVMDGNAVGTLWTLGASPEWLVLGYLWNQQRFADVRSLESITVDWSTGTATIRSRAGAQSSGDRGGQQLLGVSARLGTDAAGALIEAGALPKLGRTRISRTTLLSVIESVPQDEAVYRAAGSVHGCALFSGPDLWISVEDVSRRNALDTIIGWMALHGVSGNEKILFTTGRLTAEIVAKAAYSGVSIVVSRKGITASCYDLAAKLEMTLFGHAAKGRYLCYAGLERFDVNT